MARCCHKEFGRPGSKDRRPQNRDDRYAIDCVALFHRVSLYVDVALMCFGQAKTRLFKSGSIYLISLLFLVAGTGFEPVTFRL